MVEVEASAAGKIILHGEHAVVHGKTAVATALALRTRISISARLVAEDSQPSIKLNLCNLGVARSWNSNDIAVCCIHAKPLSSSTSAAAAACCPPSEADLQRLQVIAKHDNATVEISSLVFLYLLTHIIPQSTVASNHLLVTAESALPVGAGLGSSAAYSVSLVGALLGLAQYVGQETDLSMEQRRVINEWAFQAERLMHGNPSGVDNSVSTYGGMIRFKSGNIVPLAKKPVLRIILVNTKVPRSTKALVAGVGLRKNKYPAIMNPILDSMEAITEQALVLLEELANNATDELYSQLEDLIDINQGVLNSIGVGHEQLTRICMIASAHSQHAKLTGAGGGGCAFILLRDNVAPSTVAAILGELRELQFDCFETHVGDDGVLVKTTNL